MQGRLMRKLNVHARLRALCDIVLGPCELLVIVSVLLQPEGFRKRVLHMLDTRHILEQCMTL